MDNNNNIENIIYKPLDNLRQLDYRFDAEHAKIYITSFIDEGLIELLMMRVDYIINTWARMGMRDDLKSIDIILSSYGGDIYESLAVIDYFEHLLYSEKIRINVDCYGKAMSSAIILLSAATGKRRMSKRAFILFDEFKNTAPINKNAGVGFKTTSKTNGKGNSEYDEKIDNHMDELNGYMIKILVDSTNRDESFWVDIQKKDVYLPAEKCLEYNLIDEIIT